MLQDLHSRRTTLLTVDIGNTIVHIGVFEAEDLKATKRIATERVVAEEGISDLTRDVRAMAISSVVPSVTPLFEDLAVKLGIESFIVDHKLDLGIELGVDEPSQVGADRICNAVAAHVKYGSPAIVIDFGTAITFDVLDTGGIYVGGAIIPGVSLCTEVLARRTAQLPLIEFRRPESPIGTTTEEAIRAGVFYGTTGGVKTVYEKICEHMEDVELILTGGSFDAFKGELDIGGSYDPNLTLVGLRLIYERNRD